MKTKSTKFDRKETLAWIREIEANFAEETVNLDDMTDDELTGHANELVDRLNNRKSTRRLASVFPEEGLDEGTVL